MKSLNDQPNQPITLADLRQHREKILALAQQHGAHNVRVFGSILREERRHDSDVDLLVSWDYACVSSWGGTGFDMALENLLGVKVDVVSDAGLSPYLRARILREAVPL
jgi:predicted nucleotidyltransferase